VLADALLAGEIPLPPGPAPILELGCGVGLASVAAALAGAGRARVLATDREPRALKLTAANAARNEVAAWVQTQQLDWTEGYPARHRLILAADCLYAPDAGQEVLKFLGQGLERDHGAAARAIIVDPDRWSARDFGLLARQAGFRVRAWRRPVPFSFSLGAKALLPHSGPPTDADVRGDQPIEATFYELTF
jgi:SAM-dependent methyltransferase